MLMTMLLLLMMVMMVMIVIIMMMIMVGIMTVMMLVALLITMIRKRRNMEGRQQRGGLAGLVCSAEISFNRRVGQATLRTHARTCSILSPRNNSNRFLNEYCVGFALTVYVYSLFQ